MFKSVRHCSKPLRLLVVFAALAAVLGSACASVRQPVLSKLDPRTMVTINYLNSPFIFFRVPAGAPADAREFVYAGPLEANRSGDYRYYFWVATWSTMDTGLNDRPLERLESVNLVANGKAMTLKLNGSSAQSVGASEAVYPKPVGWATEVYYDVTVEQLRSIAAATDLQLVLPSTGERFGPWDDQVASKAGLAEFLMRADL